ncbi:acetyltransferase domain-containing protein [Galbibacter marinus]|uniref:Acetyltransferase domain-containing protein n=1 Tax=Galbibacter marinus TaxID=555500 RepID=K2Q0G1_9FLAO|nr:GNAT family N-acetyltransferase [Galbibacter marinus]EKF54331.1 acetyltransferase domain-containing protein [Galbibacter marinus]
MKNLNENIYNLTTLWQIVGDAYGKYCFRESYSYSNIENSQWPNRIWLNSQPSKLIISEILVACGQGELPRSLSYWADFDDPNFRYFESDGLVLKSEQVGMSLVVSKKEYPSNRRIKLHKITSPAQPLLWEKLYPQSFGYVISAETVKYTMDHINYFLIYHNENPIGTVLTFTTNSVVGIHGMGIIPSFRKQGFAKEVMLELLNNAAKENILLATLQASSMGKSVYKDIGFSEDFLVRNYRIL